MNNDKILQGDLYQITDSETRLFPCVDGILAHSDISFLYVKLQCSSVFVVVNATSLHPFWSERLSRGCPGGFMWYEVLFDNEIVVLREDQIKLYCDLIAKIDLHA